MGIGRRNAEFVLQYNPRRNYPRVDDKLLTKKLAIAAGLPVPDLYAVVREEHEIGELHARLAGCKDGFVVKPAHGSGGDGILVLTGRKGDRYRRASGNLMPRVVFLGVPVMAMIRLPTRQSDGKANLHQGAIGVGIDLPTGTTRRGVFGTEVVREHPDTEHPLVGLSIPHWDDLLEMSARCCDLSGLGYIGVDFVLDRDRGPMILELNARPGLAIQIANGNGLLHRLRQVEALRDGPGLPATSAERAAFARTEFPTRG